MGTQKNIHSKKNRKSRLSERNGRSENNMRKRYQGGGIIDSIGSPNYNYGGTSGLDLAPDIGGIFVYLPAAIMTGIQAITSTIRLPGDIGGMINEVGAPSPSEYPSTPLPPA